MNFAEALASFSIPNGRACGLCAQLDERNDADELWAAIDGETYSVPIVRRALNEVGIKVGDESVRRHRRGECRTRGLR